MKVILLCIWLLIFLGCTTARNSQSNFENQVDFNIEIKQNVSGSYTQNTFVIVGDRFFIYENSTTKEGQSERKEIYSKEINIDALNEITQLLSPLFDLKSEYIKAELGGVRWEISLISKERIKKIVVENYSVKEIDVLFNAINKIIPNKKPVIYKY